MNINLSNVQFIGNVSYKYVKPNYKNTNPSTPISSNSDKTASFNEKNTLSSVIYTDFLLSDTNTTRSSDNSKDSSVSTTNSDTYFDTNSYKSLEIYGHINYDPTKDTCYSSLSADGSDSLTPEQEAYLKERYDLNNLTWDEYKKYLGDLTMFNVLSFEAYRKLVMFKETIQNMVNNGAYNGTSPPDSWTPIPDGVFNMYDYLVEEHEKALHSEKLNKAYDVNNSTFVSSFYEKLIRICNSIKE